MAIRVKIDPIGRELHLAFDEMLSPAARSKLFAETASTILADADQTNRSVLGRVPRSRTWVDSREGAPLESVKPDGVIVREYELMDDVLLFISDELKASSPIGKGGDHRPGHPGFYRDSHTIFADMVEIQLGGAVPAAEEYVFMSDAPYARRLERRAFIYEKTAAKAKQRFGNIAKIQFTYRGLVAGMALQKSGPIKRAREAGRWKGRFAKMGGPQAQNASAVRFPAIVITAR